MRTMTNLVFFGICDWVSFFERREYELDEPLSFLELGVEDSSSETESGIARFLPLGSRVGSLMINAAGIGGCVALRVLLHILR